jgi:hypothetical protein
LFIPAFAWANIDTTIQGVPVNFSYTEYIFPESWRLSPINGMGESLGREEINRSKSIIIRALKKYPAPVLLNNLNSVYVLKSIKFYDVGYGGTNSTAEVFVTNNGIPMGYTDTYVEQTFHHEFSSILFRNYPDLLDAVAWAKANIPGFDYNDPENGVGAIRKNESSQELDTVLCSKGFLTQYALSGLENDINTMAQNLFTPAPGFWRIVDNFPRINRKTKLLIQFYNGIDPAFTEDFFRKQAR